MITNKREGGVPDPLEFQRRFAEMFRTPPPPKPEADGGGVDDGQTPQEKPPTIRFDMKPEELEAYLNQYVIKQGQAKEILATKICTHFNRMRLEENRGGEQDDVGNIKNNIILIGPTGVGKTYLIKLIAGKIGVPFVKGDATKFSETGYVGGDVEDLIRDLVRGADGDLDTAQYGIVYIDEIDKIASSGTVVGPDVSRTGVQRALLKLMEETEVDLRVPHDLASQMEAVMQFQRTGKLEKKKINTKHILFIVSGAFNGLEDIIKRRLNKQAIGFGSEQRPRGDTTETYLKQVKSEDLIQYGFESEFVGRVPVVAVLEELTVDDLYQILKNPNNSVIMGKKRDFEAYGIQIEFEDAALRRIAELAAEERTGARGLVSVCERVLLKFEKKLPSTDIRRFMVTEDIVNDPERGLTRLLTVESVREYEEEFFRTHGIRLTFSDRALEILGARAQAEGISAGALCRRLLEDYGYGLKLVQRDVFVVTEEVLDDPKGVVDRLIKAFYSREHEPQGAEVVEPDETHEGVRAATSDELLR